MPKLKMTPTEKKLEYLSRLIESKIKLYGIKNVAALATRVGVSKATMYDRLKHPDKMALIELLRISEILRFTDEEKGLII